jgi:hypothetical protein
MGLKNVSFRRTAISIIAFGLGGLIIIGAGTYKKSLTNEAPNFRASFEKGNETFKEFVYDINNQGFPKRLIQPGKISVSTGHGGEIVNKTDKAILVNVRTEGLPGKPELESVNPSFDEKSKRFVKPIKPGESLSLGVDLEIPRSLLSKNHIVSQGSVIFEDANDGTILGTLPVKIINSAIRE